MQIVIGILIGLLIGGIFSFINRVIEIKENKQLKERIDKAIEYMEKSMNFLLKYEWVVLKHTLEILKGE